MKQCSKCKEVKLFDCFSPDRRVSSGLQSRCKSCVAEHQRLKYAENPEHRRKLVSESTKRNYAKKIERNNRYRAENPDKVTAWKKKDRELNKARINADNAKRRGKLQGSLSLEIKQLYILKDFYQSMSLGEVFHVDHIVPLAKGGQHHIENLQIIPAKDNLRKGAN
jgi:5-methylcytosine-specific restriction endonuclease McrA